MDFSASKDSLECAGFILLQRGRESLRLGLHGTRWVAITQESCELVGPACRVDGFSWLVRLLYYLGTGRIDPGCVVTNAGSIVRRCPIVAWDLNSDGSMVGYGRLCPRSRSGFLSTRLWLGGHLRVAREPRHDTRRAGLSLDLLISGRSRFKYW